MKYANNKKTENSPNFERENAVKNCQENPQNGKQCSHGIKRKKNVFMTPTLWVRVESRAYILSYIKISKVLIIIEQCQTSKDISTSVLYTSHLLSL